MSLAERIESMRAEANKLTAEIKSIKEEKSTVTLSQYVSNGEAPKGLVKPKKRATLKGHFGKVYALHWCAANEKRQNLLSASQDGKLILWNARIGTKKAAIPLRSSWVMACALEPTKGCFVASGGLDNLVTIHDMGAAEGGSPNKRGAELAMHDGYVSCARFLSESRLLSCSGDSTAILWDLDTSVMINKWKDHGGDVMSISICPKDENLFVSDACDTAARIFDLREDTGCTMKFEGHESDINSVAWMPDGKSFISGSDDSTVRLFDIRSYQEVEQYTDSSILCGITSVDPTKSGRIIFAGYDDYSCNGWDTLTAEKPHQLMGHENRVSCLGVQHDGGAVATGSWDTQLMTWA